VYFLTLAWGGENRLPHHVTTVITLAIGAALSELRRGCGVVVSTFSRLSSRRSVTVSIGKLGSSRQGSLSFARREKRREVGNGVVRLFPYRGGMPRAAKPAEGSTRWLHKQRGNNQTGQRNAIISSTCVLPGLERVQGPHLSAVWQLFMPGLLGDGRVQ